MSLTASLAWAAMWTTAATPILSADERAPAVCVVTTPTEGRSHFTVSEVRTAVDQVLREETGLRLLPIDPTLDRCVGRPSCFARSLASVEDGGQRPPLLIAVSLRGDGFLVVSLFDLPRAIALGMERGDLARDPDALDGVIFERASLDDGAATAPRDVGDLLDTVRGSIRAASGRSAALSKLGVLQLDVDVADAVVEIDGRLIGTTPLGRVDVVDLRLGRRSLAVSKAGHVTHREVVDVADDGLALEKIRLPVVSSGFPGTVVWPTAGLLGAATVLVGVGIASAGDQAGTCVARPEVDCQPHPRFTRLFAGEGGGVGPMTVPLGYSLGVSGLTYAAAQGLMSDDAHWWLAPLIALVAGALTYSLTEIVVTGTE